MNPVFVDTITTYVVFAESNDAVLFVDTPDSFVVFTEGAQGLSGATALVWNETPSGTLDGSNATFTLASSPASSSKLLLSNNGLLLQHGASNDFVLSTNSITFNAGAIPVSGDSLLATYSTV